MGLDLEPSVSAKTYILPPDVLFVPASELAPSVLGELGDSDGQVAVTRPGFRVPVRLVDEATAALLREFETPSPIAEAIVRFSKDRGLDPRRTLEEAFPVLLIFSASRILVTEASPHLAGVPVARAPGQMIEGFEIIAALQTTHDTEVYRAQDASGQEVALKIAQAEADEEAANAIDREVAALQLIGGELSPRIVAVGNHGKLPYLATSWFEGVPATRRAAAIRQGCEPGWRARLHRLACRVVECFSRLHGLGILHGDIHGRNILVGADDEVHVLDFGVSLMVRQDCPLDHDVRAGFGWNLDPASVALLLEGKKLPALNGAAERYAIAAFVYELVVGEHYLKFSTETGLAYRQVLTELPLPFTRRGFENWPSFEAVLRRELSKDEGERHGSTADLLRALQQASPPEPEHLASEFREVSRSYVDSFVPAESTPFPRMSDYFRGNTRASIERGAAGLGWFLYRLAVLREAPRYLAMADIWCRRAAAEIGQADAFYSPTAESEVQIDPCSVLHRAPGIHFVHALVCQARGDLRGLAEQTTAFLNTSRGPSMVADVALGKAGTVLACCTLKGATVAFDSLNLGGPLNAAIGDGFEALVSALEMDRTPGLVDHQPFSFAHGRVGILYTLLRASVALGRPASELPASVVSGLNRLLPSGPETPGSEIPGWCNGAAGQVPLFLLAHELLGDELYLREAERAGRLAFEHPGDHGHLCCGLAGRVISLLQMHRHTGGEAWLDSARRLGRGLLDPKLPEGTAPYSHSLFWGPLGCALALEELSVPERSTMPIFGDMDWPRSHFNGVPEPFGAIEQGVR